MMKHKINNMRTNSDERRVKVIEREAVSSRIYFW